MIASEGRDNGSLYTFHVFKIFCVSVHYVCNDTTCLKYGKLPFSLSQKKGGGCLGGSVS